MFPKYTFTKTLLPTLNFKNNNIWLIGRRQTDSSADRHTDKDR